MIKAINFLGKPDAPGAVSNIAAPKPEAKAEAPAPTPQAPAPTPQAPAQDTFVPSAPKAEEAPKADPNDKFVKAEDKKPEEAK